MLQQFDSPIAALAARIRSYPSYKAYIHNSYKKLRKDLDGMNSRSKSTTKQVRAEDLQVKRGESVLVRITPGTVY